MGQPQRARRKAVVLSSDEEDVVKKPALGKLKRPTKSAGNKTQASNLRRKQALAASSSEDGLGPDSTSPQRSTKISELSSRKQLNSAKAATQAASPTSSAADARSTAKNPQAQKEAKADAAKSKEKKIYSFFNTATQKQQSHRSISPDKATVESGGDEDLIEDDSVGEDMAALDGDGTINSLPLRSKRKRDVLDDTGPLANNGTSLGSQKFIKTASAPAHPTDVLSKQQTFEDLRPWTEKYGPDNVNELAVHVKKTREVQNWLKSVLDGKDRKRLLVLKGTAGTGKTATLNLLSHELGFEISEWKNPSSGEYLEDGFLSLAAQFEDYLGRAGTFGGLEFATAEGKPVGQAKEEYSRRQIILMEEFPNTFSRSSAALHTFRAAIQQYLAANTPSMDSLFSREQASQRVTPLGMTLSETLVSSTTVSADSFTAHRLLGPAILNHPGTTALEFNPIAPTYMTKALDLVIRKEARKSGRRKAPGPAVLRYLAETGDIRSAISSLEFLCVRGDELDGDGGGWGGKVAFTKPRKAAGSNNTALTQMERESLEIITQRESTLGIFHAVGKVVYNKREAPSATDTPTLQPPPHLPQCARPKISGVNTDSLIDELGTDIQTFIAALHENYVLSCAASSSEDTLDSINGCMDALGDADLLSPDRFGAGTGRRAFSGSASDTLRQDEMSFFTAVHGLLFELPHPVKRAAPPPSLVQGRGGGRRDAFQMLYPTSLRLWRQKEEIEGVVDLFVDRAQRGDLSTVKPKGSAQSKAGGVETWRRNTSLETPPNSSLSPQKAPSLNSRVSEDGPTSVLVGSGASARVEMLLERLPYMAAILRRRSPDASSIIREIQSVTRFTGVGVVTEDGEQDELEGLSSAATKFSNPAKRQLGSDTNGVVGISHTVDGLVLSDDDIED